MPYRDGDPAFVRISARTTMGQTYTYLVERDPDGDGYRVAYLSTVEHVPSWPAAYWAVARHVAKIDADCQWLRDNPHPYRATLPC